MIGFGKFFAGGVGALAVGVFSSCQTQPPMQSSLPLNRPVTARTVGTAYADYAFEVADTDRNGFVSRPEWLAAGGAEMTFDAIDENRNASLTRTEFVDAASNEPFLLYAKNVADINRDSNLTPKEMRTYGGVQLLRYGF